jgi:hypothetical protein
MRFPVIVISNVLAFRVTTLCSFYAIEDNEFRGYCGVYLKGLSGFVEQLSIRFAALYKGRG